LPTPPAENVVSGFPVEKLARSLRPGDEPASMKYAVGGQPPAGAAQDRVTVAPLAEAVRLVGAFGTAPHDPPPPTVRTVSFDGALTPALFLDRTRTK